MKNIIKGITYSYNRNIGWQDRTLRTIAGIAVTVCAIYYANTEPVYSMLLGILAIVLFSTVLSARCMVCYFTGRCTIDSKERKALEARNVTQESKGQRN